MGVRQFIGIASLLFCVGAVASSAQSVTNRVTGGISTSSMVELKGSAHPLALTKNDAGRMSSGTRLTGMTLHFALTDAQKAELNTLVAAQQTPGSSYYHQWLTPASFAKRFGLSASDIEQVESWLEQQGFTVDRVANSRTSIRFSGSVGQAESSFGATMHYYTVGGVKHFANASALTIPSALSGVVGSIGNLNNFKPKPHVKLRKDFTSSTSGSYYMTPLDVATIYDITAAYNNGYTGSGQSIAVMGQSAIVTSDIEAFQKALGWTTYRDPTIVLVPSCGTSTVVTGDEAESDLDLEYTSTIAKGATIYFVYTGSTPSCGVFDSIEYAVDTRLAPILSVSYGECEPDMSSSDYTSLENTLEQGASQGQSIIVSSGDDGSTGCYQDYTSGSLTTAEKALAVEYPASSAYATALGGTEFPSADLSSTYWNSASGSDVISSAKSYIPEQVWNDDSASAGSSDGASYALSAGGGGVSILTTRPTWQTSTSLPGLSTATDYSKDYRMVPDISLASSPSYPGYLYCSSDSDTEITGSCSNGFRDTNSKYLTVAGGTSFAAPIFAGMLGILNQAKNYDYQGLINTELYTLATTATTYASAFHDTTSGGNECSAGTSYCSTAGAAAYYATTGYDEASGLGSVDLYNLISAWPTATATVTGASYGSTTTLTAASVSPTSGASDAITIAVASGSSSSTTTPTGTLSVYVDGSLKTSTLALASGMASYSFSSTTSGAHTITATYSGDANYYASTGSVVVSISSGSSSGSGTGGTGTSTVTVTPAGGYTGTVDFTLSTSSTSLQDDACYTLSDASVTGTSAVTSTLTLYLGSSYCSSATSATKGAVKRFAGSSANKIGAAANPVSSMRLAAFGGFGLLLAGLLGWRFRRVRGWLCLLVIASFGFALSGCSSGASSTTTTATKSFTVALSPATMTISAGTSGVATGSYTLTVKGADSASSSLASTATLTLTVD